MRVLRPANLTKEQLPLLDYKPGFALIRGSVGSGKTSTAVFRLQSVAGVWTRQRLRTEDGTPVKVLVLTFNRALRGYMEELVSTEVRGETLDLTLQTFARWALDILGYVQLIGDAERAAELWRLGAGLGYQRSFLLDEVAYVLGRFLPENIDEYANPSATTYERTGRGIAPKVERPQRERLLDEVVRPYLVWKSQKGALDWTDVAVRMAQRTPTDFYDIVLVDEAQDFSANQIRGIVNHLATDHSTTLVLDAVQRLYPHGFGSWGEVGVPIHASNSYRLTENHRNTKEIAAFARPLVAGLPLDIEGTLPDLDSCLRTGSRPVVLRGRFSEQMTWLLNNIAGLPADESVALLHPKGGGFFDYARSRLHADEVQFAEMQAQAEWPQGSERVGLSTLHSAKGLEFDHVVVLGVNGQLMPGGTEDDDIQLELERRLVAVAITRARESVVLTYKPDDPPALIEFLDPLTFDIVDL